MGGGVGTRAMNLVGTTTTDENAVTTAMMDDPPTMVDAADNDGLEGRDSRRAAVTNAMEDEGRRMIIFALLDGGG